MKMDNYLPQNGLHVTMFGKQGAEKWVRHAYNIPPNVGCWEPYRILIQSYGCTAYCAFYTLAEFKCWLSTRNAKVRLDPYHGEFKAPGWNAPRSWVARFGHIEATA